MEPPHGRPALEHSGDGDDAIRALTMDQLNERVDTLTHDDAHLRDMGKAAELAALCEEGLRRLRPLFARGIAVEPPVTPFFKRVSEEEERRRQMADLRIFWGPEVCRLEYLVHLLDTGRVVDDAAHRPIPVGGVR